MRVLWLVGAIVCLILAVNCVLVLAMIEFPGFWGTLLLVNALLWTPVGLGSAAVFCINKSIGDYMG